MGAGSMGFRTESTSAFDMVITSAGHVGIGTTSPADSAWNHGTYGNTEVAIDGNGGYGALHFRGDGSGATNTRFSIGVGDDKFYMAYDDVDGRHNIIVDGSGDVTFAGDLVMADGKGIDFGVTTPDGSGNVAYETLDDYEEGSWSPVLDGTSGGFYNMMGIVGGRYTKIGNKVYLQAQLQWDATNHVGYSGALAITGLPFASVAGVRAGGNIHAVSAGISYTSGYNRLCLVIDPGGTLIYIIQNATTGAGYSHTPSVGSSGTIYGFNISYIAS
jgi:hypothetical protein